MTFRLRLSGTDALPGHDASPVQSTSFVEIVVRVPWPAAHGPLAMPPQPTAILRAPSAPAPQAPVAGRIEATPPTDIDAKVERWLTWMADRSKRPKVIADYRRLVMKAKKDNGWTSPADVTYDSVVGWLRSHKWSASTLARNLSVFRGLTGFWVKDKTIADDPLILAVSARADPAEGSRAATTEEARNLIAFAWHSQIADSRSSKGNRSLYWTVMFLAGLRASEPAVLKWSDIDLVDGVITWTPDMHKARRRQIVALCPELVELLKREKDATPKDAGRVFSAAPSRPTFREDRDRAGIPVVDRRNRKFSPHSARKWFKTTLCESGVQADVVDYLMRHALTTGARYADFSLDAQRAALATLPRLWPEKNFMDRKSSLTNGAINGEDLLYRTAHEEPPDHHEHDPRIAGPGREGRCGNHPATPAPAFRGPCDGLEQPRQGRLSGPGRSTTICEPVMPITGLQNGVDPTWLAELLELTAGLLRQGAARVEPARPEALSRNPAPKPSPARKQRRAS